MLLREIDELVDLWRKNPKLYDLREGLFKIFDKMPFLSDKQAAVDTWELRIRRRNAKG